ncbi:AbrB family transcriptional regulator [Microbaculum marinum]|uniref:AbrB family transcriptional regulator n=1 Tax=Microbaculum marinum TaxID=1764581 RepID=A0AAW9RPY2_9HYPH
MIRLPARKDVLRELPGLGMTMALAAAGGLAFAMLGLPVPWISGSMIVVAAAALMGAPTIVPRWVREIVFFVLGLNIGSAVTPETIAGIGSWPASIVILIVALPILSVSCAVPLVYFRGWSRDDAMLASIPGALSLIMALADATDADVPRIALVQAVRVAILVALLPPLISMTSGLDLTMAMPQSELPGLYDLVLLIGLGFIGVLLMRLARFPAAGLMGALIASAALHGTDVVSATLPSEVLMVSFVVLGAGIGARFAGLGWHNFRAGLFDAAMTFAIGFVVSVLTAIVATAWLGFPFGQTILAFAPGALEVMVVMAFLLGLDAAYVGAHHTVRFLVLVLLAPLILRRRPGKQDETQDPLRGP